MKILVSMCNKVEADALLPGIFLFELDLPSGEVSPVLLEDSRMLGGNGITGLARLGEDLLAVVQHAPPLLVQFTRQYQVKDVWFLGQVKDGHSLTTANGQVYIASANSDSIVQFNAHAGESIFWSALSPLRGAGAEQPPAHAPDGDTVHVNSVCWNRGCLYATVFGPKKGDLWRTADEGYLINVTSGEVVLERLHHPHSVTTLADEADAGVFLCDSWHQEVVAENGQRFAAGGGYTRGLIVTPTRLILGLSRGRTKSRSTGLETANLAAPGWAGGQCGIRVYACAGGDLRSCELLQSLSFGAYGDEIYDLLLL